MYCQSLSPELIDSYRWWSHELVLAFVSLEHLAEVYTLVISANPELINRFEVQFGIICACIPTLIPGYKWIKHQMFGTTKASEKLSPIQHSGPHKRKDGDITELLRSAEQADRPGTIGENSPYNNTLVTAEYSPPGSRSAELSEKDAVEAPSGQIRKTTRVDVQRTDSIKRCAPLPGQDNVETKPRTSLDVNLRPSFEDNRPVFREILDPHRYTVEDRV